MENFYFDVIQDAIIEYRCRHKSRNPERIVMSSKLFDMLTDGKGNKEKSKFCSIRVKVYESNDIEFGFVEKLITEREILYDYR